MTSPLQRSEVTTRTLDPTIPLEARLRLACTSNANAASNRCRQFIPQELLEWVNQYSGEPLTVAARTDSPSTNPEVTAAAALSELCASALCELLLSHDLGNLNSPADSHRLLQNDGAHRRWFVPSPPVAFPRNHQNRPLRANALGVGDALHHGAQFVLRSLELGSPALDALLADLATSVQFLATATLQFCGPAHQRMATPIADLSAGPRRLLLQTLGTSQFEVFESTAVDVIDSGTLSPGDWLALPEGVHVRTSHGNASAAQLLLSEHGDRTSNGISEYEDPPHRNGFFDLAEAAHVLIDERSTTERHSLSPSTLGETEGLRLRLRSNGVHRVQCSEDRCHLVLGPVDVPIEERTVSALEALLSPAGMAMHEASDQEPALRQLLGSLLARGIIHVDNVAASVESPPTKTRALLEQVISGRVLPPAGRLTSIEALSLPSGSLRLPTDHTELEMLLLNANLTLRNSAAERFAELISGVDLIGAMNDPADAEPSVGRLTSVAQPLLGQDQFESFLWAQELSGARMAVSSEGVAFNAQAPADLFRTQREPHEPTRIDVRRLQKFLSGRHSAVFFGIDDSLPHLDSLAQIIEALAGVRSGANAYLSIDNRSAGFGAHWDDHDVLIVQAVGHKTWRLHRPTEKYPVRGFTTDEVSGPPVAELTLSPGDVLYLPRGWGHLVAGTSGPSLHYTFPMRTPQLSMVGAPQFRHRKHPLPWVLGEWRAGIPSRARQSLASLPPDPLSESSTLRLSAPGGVAVHDQHHGAGTIGLGFSRHLVEVQFEEIPVIARLLSGDSVPTSELLPLGRPRQVRGLLRGLLLGGLMTATDLRP